MTDVRKSLASLLEELRQYENMSHKTFVHKGTGENYRLIAIAFDEATNEVKAVYRFCALPKLKFVRPMAEFIERFAPLGSV